MTSSFAVEYLLAEDEKLPLALPDEGVGPVAVRRCNQLPHALWVHRKHLLRTRLSHQQLPLPDDIVLRITLGPPSLANTAQSIDREVGKREMHGNSWAES